MTNPAHPKWAVVRKTGQGSGFTYFEVTRIGKRFTWLMTGLGELRYTTRRANWLFDSREDAAAKVRELEDAATDHVKRIQGRA